MKERKVTAIITAYNRKAITCYCLKWLQSIPEIANVIVVDNGSEDGTSEALAELGCDYIFFDEGIQNYSIAWNAAVMNFDMEEVIVFIQPQYLPGKECICRLLETLEKEKCGIAGPMCNGVVSGQRIQIDDVDDLYKLEMMSQKERTEAFRSLDMEYGIWAVSKEVWNEIGMFDEEVGEPRNVFLDYKLRLIKRGRYPMVCRQAFAYDISQGGCMLSDGEGVGNSDKNILHGKWNMNYFNLLPAHGIVGLISEEKEAAFRVLEVGCDLGATLLAIQNRYPQSYVCGLEINEASAAISSHLMDVKVGNIEDMEIPFEGIYDYIIFGDVLEHLHAPEAVLNYCKDKLTDSGCVLASIPNLMHVSVMEHLLNGRFPYSNIGLLDRSHIHFFTYHEICKMFCENGFEIEQTEIVTMPMSEEWERLIDKLMQISTNVEKEMYYAYQYLIKARKCGK